MSDPVRIIYEPFEESRVGIPVADKSFHGPLAKMVKKMIKPPPSRQVVKINRRSPRKKRHKNFY